MGFAACSQMSFRILVEGRREACIKRFEGRMHPQEHCREAGERQASSSRALKGCGGEAGTLKSIEGNREVCILKSFEGSWGRHASSRALKGGRRHASSNNKVFKLSLKERLKSA